MPNCVEVWTTLALLLFDRDKYDSVETILDRILFLEPEDYLALKYSAIFNTGVDTQKGIAFAERMVNAVVNKGGVLDAHDRSTYGFALLAAGMRYEARAQFNLVCGSDEPEMTLEQWLDWGHKLKSQLLASRLLDVSLGLE
jgi:hypothetical protein